MSQRPAQSRQPAAQERHKTPAASPEPVRVPEQQTRQRAGDRRTLRSQWLLGVARAAHQQGVHEATWSTLTLRFERARHPWTGKAIVQVRSKGKEELQLADVRPQEITDMGGNARLIYWARIRGQGTRVLVEAPYVLAIVTAEHSAGGTAAGLGKAEGPEAGFVPGPSDTIVKAP